MQGQRANSQLARQARWRLAWAELGEGHYSAAAKRLVPLTRGSQWDIEVQRARYWRAIARLQRDAQDGQAMLTELTESVPLSYYGLMAADYLESVPPIERSFLGKRPGPVRDPSPRRARWLLRAGFLEAAQDEVGSWVHGSKLDRAGRLTAARLLHDVGEHLRAVRTILDGFGGALEQGIDPAWREAWQLAWPRPFDASVEDAVEEFEFDPSLVYAIMREESTYYAAARSPAGALGLMQIIPPTGDRIARKLGSVAFQPEDLLNPDLNIRFGTYYLKYLLERFKGSSALAIAAYNAGPDVVTFFGSGR